MESLNGVVSVRFQSKEEAYSRLKEFFADYPDLIESISNVTRIKIIRALAETPLAAGDLARVVDRTAPATSQHIRVLRDAGVIESTRSGNVVRYHLTNSTSAQILEVIARAFDVLAR